ncbi:uncharacterized protein LOC104877354 isoform X1 [Vitis vinifera]|uniref:uncharacterized protein LOC104877354 isoform X1 n=2 Tax=Vitis vinifera TaxID=29760 RepID=UPI00053F7B40|nr:uncharacterized protein LOC104877354 isoform X1 [Vitis vinifera]|eukprot:XP_010645971.1 PREDICTED: uncharacterized protein LOC104877354 isoform X1 [Vitis vinifera]
MDIQQVLGSNRLEDVNWLCSLAESELDMLISLKMMVLRRAKVIGHEDLAEKFDLKMLRALGFILMEYLRGQVKDLSTIPGLAGLDRFFNECNLLKCSLKDPMSTEEQKACISTNSKRRTAKRSCEEMAPNPKKQKTETRGSDSDQTE